MNNVITIDGIDLGTLGFRPRTRDLPTTGEKSSYQVALGRPGGHRNGGTIPPGSLQITGTVVAPDRETALQRYRQIIAVCRPGAFQAVSVAFSDMPDVQFKAHLAEGTGPKDLGKEWRSEAREVVLKFDLAEPFAEATKDTSLSLTDGVAEDLPLGNAPSSPVVTVSPTSSTVTIEVLGFDGTVIRGLTWEGDPAGGNLVIDAFDFTAEQGGSNVLDEVDVASVFPVLKPSEGAAQILVSGGAATVEYRKKWWV